MQSQLLVLLIFMKNKLQIAVALCLEIKFGCSVSFDYLPGFRTYLYHYTVAQFRLAAFSVGLLLQRQTPGSSSKSNTQLSQVIYTLTHP